MNAAPEPTAHIGLCRLEQAFDSDGAALTAPEGETLPTFEAPIAAFVGDGAQYDTLVANLVRDDGYRLLRTEEVMPIKAWFTAKGFNKNLADLAAKVHLDHRMMLGEVRAVGFEQSRGMEGTVGQGEGDQGPLIITEHAFNELPDQSKIWPPSERQWIDPKLKELLFGQSLPKEHQHILKDAEPGENSNPPLIRTYFICDAHLRRKITKIFDLDRPNRWKLRPTGAEVVKGPNGNEGHINFQSLFKGEAAEELKEVAPYLFELTLPDGAYDNDKQVPKFHKDFFKELHDQVARTRAEKKTHLDTGFFFRTADKFKSVWKHFRRFTRVQDQNRNWYYWRFWDIWLMREYLIGKFSKSSEMHRLITADSLRFNAEILCLSAWGDAMFCATSSPAYNGIEAKKSIENFSMASVLRPHAHSLLRDLLKKFPKKNTYDSVLTAENKILKSMLEMHMCGLTRLEFLKEIASQEYFMNDTISVRATHEYLNRNHLIWDEQEKTFLEIIKKFGLNA